MQPNCPSSKNLSQTQTLAHNIFHQMICEPLRGWEHMPYLDLTRSWLMMRSSGLCSRLTPTLICEQAQFSRPHPTLIMLCVHVLQPLDARSMLVGVLVMLALADTGHAWSFARKFSFEFG